jgi:hypothetical protein
MVVLQHAPCDIDLTGFSKNWSANRAHPWQTSSKTTANH